VIDDADDDLIVAVYGDPGRLCAGGAHRSNAAATRCHRETRQAPVRAARRGMVSGCAGCVGSHRARVAALKTRCTHAGSKHHAASAEP
jgi:hypothetical protein